MLKSSNLWLILIGLAMVTYCLHLLNQSNNRANNAERALAQYIAAQSALVAKQDKEYAEKLAIAQNQTTIAQFEAQQQLDKLNIDREQSTKDLKALYENKISHLKRAMVSNSSGVLPSTGSTEQATETTSNTSKFAESESECYTTIAGLQEGYDTLESACIVTTVDYNQLRGWADVVCGMAICE